jgi:hypothetical protein
VEGEALKGLKALLCAGLVAAVIGATGGPAAAPAAAVVQTQCPPPAVNGFTITGLFESGIGCHHASQLALHLIHHGTAPADWTCTLTISGRHVTWNCVHHHFPDYTLRLVYYVH